MQAFEGVELLQLAIGLEPVTPAGRVIGAGHFILFPFTQMF